MKLKVDGGGTEVFKDPELPDLDSATNTTLEARDIGIISNSSRSDRWCNLRTTTLGLKNSFAPSPVDFTLNMKKVAATRLPPIEVYATESFVTVVRDGKNTSNESLSIGSK